MRLFLHNEVDNMPNRVIIDTDPGIDDALAFLLALQSPELEIVAVTTVSGNVPVEIATTNIFTVLSLLPLIEKPPVARGASRPLKKDPFFATHFHGDDGLGELHRFRDVSGNPRYAPQSITLSDRDAVHEILHQLSITSEPITVIALGPLTNIAAAIEKDRVTMKKIHRIVLMGGAIGVPGNITPVAEFNIYFDPHAASIVFDSGIPLTVVGLDVTHQVRLTKNMIKKALTLHQTTTNQFICDCTEKLFAFAKENEWEESFPLHDPLAVGVVIDPSFVTTEAMHVEIETKGQFTEGMTVADQRSLRPMQKKPPNIDVSVNVDASRFLSFFLERVLSLKSS